MTVENGLFQIVITGKDRSFICRSGETVLRAMERQGIKQLAIGCRGGGCGFCRVRVSEGTYDVGKMSRAQVSDVDQQAGYALACRLYPHSDLRLMPARRCTND